MEKNGLNPERAFLPEDIVALLSNGVIQKAAQETLDFIDKEYIR